MASDYDYKWTSVEGMGEDNAATAETPIGRLKVQQRRPGMQKFVARVRGDTIGRDYIGMHEAKLCAEHKVRKLLAERAKAR